MSDSVTVPVRHNEVLSRFEADLGGELAVAEYRRAGNRMIFFHTWVPPEQRGRGIAAQLVRAALDNARSRGRVVVPECSYVARFIQRHREYADLLE